MEISAVGVTATDLARAVGFYSLLGFSFPPLDDGEDHVESTNAGARLMIDSVELITGRATPRPSPSCCRPPGRSTGW
jgi:hypothetical protein